ncbi:hypothetical protein CU098_009283 [Rhizopus stolonifer]|uniref:Uncharacterized protein n=1 Tax=Rhizopus stolonifer TaxID=4846 RepID=A0A367JR90_RHIST|nr:hypothetical protein CU098_009283 [Rhizopus stolonifer]
MHLCHLVAIVFALCYISLYEAAHITKRQLVSPTIIDWVEGLCFLPVKGLSDVLRNSDEGLKVYQDMFCEQTIAYDESKKEEVKALLKSIEATNKYISSILLQLASRF